MNDFFFSFPTITRYFFELSVSICCITVAAALRWNKAHDLRAQSDGNASPMS